jgi:hypothetical protein
VIVVDDIACMSIHCPLTIVVMPETVPRGAPGAVERDARKQPFAVARPLAGLRALAFALRQRLGRIHRRDRLVEYVLAVHGGGDGDAESS